MVNYGSLFDRSYYRRVAVHMSNNSSSCHDENKALTEALLNNSRDRILSYGLLKRNGRILTSLECAHLGLEIAMKVLMTSTGQRYKWGHDLVVLASHFLNSGQYKDREGLTEVAEELSVFINGPSVGHKFWSTKHRYSLSEPTEEMCLYADKAVDLAKKILEAID